MSKKDLIEAYVRGELDRRGFVRSLTALGVSAAAAGAYAGTFAPGVAASSSRNEAGFLMQAQGVVNDDEYGTAFTFASDEEAVGLLLTSITELLAILLQIDTFTSDDLVGCGVDEDSYELLKRILEQEQEHADALAALIGDVQFQMPPAGDSGSSEAFLADLAEAFRRLCELYAAVAPALESGEMRQTVTNVMAITSRHAALVNEMSCFDPIPDTFQEPALQ